MFLVLTRKDLNSRTIIPVERVERIYENRDGWAVKTLDNQQHIVIDSKEYYTPSLQENPFL